MTENPPTAEGVGVLKPRAPFSFAQALAFLRRFPPTEGERPVVGDAVLGATHVDGRAIGFRVEDAGTVEAPALRVIFSVEPGSVLEEETANTVCDQIGGWLGIDDDLPAFYALTEADPPFAQV